MRVFRVVVVCWGIWVCVIVFFCLVVLVRSWVVSIIFAGISAVIISIFFLSIAFWILLVSFLRLG